MVSVLTGVSVGDAVHVLEIVGVKVRVGGVPVQVCEMLGVGVRVSDIVKDGVNV